MEKKENISAFIEDENVDHPMLSIIIPAYNEERNIEKCIMSIVNQPYSNYEVLIIDNNSTDHTLNICNKLGRENKNIYVYSEFQKGVSAARNKGLKLAKGNYVMFVDGDDFLPFGILPTLIGKMEETQDAIVQGDIVPEKLYQEQGQLGKAYREEHRTSEYIQKVTLYSAKYAAKEKEWILNSVYGVFGKLFPKKIIADLCFHEDIALGEDMLFYLETLQRAREVIIISRCVYVVNDHNEESSTRRINPELADSVETATNRLIDLYDHLSEEVQENLYYQVFRHIEVGILEQIQKICLQKTTEELVSYAKRYLKFRKEVYIDAYKIVLKQRFQGGIKKYLLYYLPIVFLKNGHYRLYCSYIRSKEKIKRYKNECRKKIS